MTVEFFLHLNLMSHSNAGVCEQLNGYLSKLLRTDESHGACVGDEAGRVMPSIMEWCDRLAAAQKATH